MSDVPTVIADPLETVLVDASPRQTDTVLVDASQQADGTILVEVTADYPPTGQTGPPGPQGDQGVQGDPGPIGPQGDTGPTGPTGATGPQGASGSDGAQGPKGDVGATGPAGATGPQGVPGVPGVNVVDTASLQDGAVTTPKLAANAVTTPALAAGAVTGAKIAGATVTEANMAASSVGTPELINGSVTTPKIANGAVTNAQLGVGAVDYTKFSGQVVKLNAAAGTFRGLQLYTSTTVPPADNPGLRWDIGVAYNAAGETGGNAGSDFGIDRYNDAGANVGQPFLISRATGNVTIAQALTINTGPLALNGGLFLSNGPNAAFKGLQLQTNGAPRWNLVAQNSSETGGNVGSDFYISRFNDAGAFVDNPFYINRASGGVVMSQNLAVGGSITATSYITAGNQLSINGVNGAWRGLYYDTNGSTRWVVGATSDNETGGNAGSNYDILRYDDAGNILGTPFNINRSNGIPFVTGLGVNPNTGWGANSTLIRLNAASAQSNGIEWWLDGYRYFTWTTDPNNNNLVLSVWNGTGGAIISQPIVCPLNGASISFSVPDLYANSGHFTNLGASGSLNVSGAASIGGTLNVTGAITAGIGVSPGANQVMIGVYVNGSWYNAQSIGVAPGGASGVVVYNGNSASSTWSMAPSDRRLKENIEKPKLDPLALVRNLPIWSCDFVPPKPSSAVPDPENWIAPTEHWAFSFMADEVEAALPNATIKDEEGYSVALHPQHLIATLWAAVQQLTERLESAETKLATLEVGA
jgi:hypothetical protein